MWRKLFKQIYDAELCGVKMFQASVRFVNMRRKKTGWNALENYVFKVNLKHLLKATSSLHLGRESWVSFNMTWIQGDQIGRIFAYWFFHFRQFFFENYRSSPNLKASFIQSKKNYLLILTKKWVKLHFGRFFHKLIWSPCLEPSSHNYQRFARHNVRICYDSTKLHISALPTSKN
jgi:hypothetical protein